jgi:predicted transposase YdaD
MQHRIAMHIDAAFTSPLLHELAPRARRDYGASPLSSTPHDALFKAVLGKAEHARGVLRTVVPAAVAEALDWPTLAPCPGNFVDARLRERFTDVLFTVTWRGGGEALVYVLFEHQSTVDGRMAWRLLRYLVQIWERWLTDHPRAARLPLIIPVVLYHGAEAWSASIEFDGLLDIPEAVRPSVAPHLPRFTYLVDDLSAIPDEELRARAMTTALSRLVAACFKYARRRADLLEILGGWADVVRDVANAPNGLGALALVVRYILLVNDHVEPEELRAFLDRVAGPEAKDTVMTAGERLIQQGEERGIQKGIQQGERALLVRLLKKRFGNAVDADIERRVEAATTEQIEVWAERVLSASTLAELLAN